MIREPSRRKVVVGIVAGLVAAGAAVYTVVASRAAMREVRSERQIAETRRRPDELGYFSFTAVDHPLALYPAPAASCAPQATDDLARGIAAARAHDPAAARWLRSALDKDPGCVGAARALINWLARAGLQITARPFREAAGARPWDAAAQVIAAYYERATGDGPAFRNRLEAASQLRPDQPLLHAGWAYYWHYYARPRSMENELRELQAEVDATGDLNSVANLVFAYDELAEYDRALGWCDRFYADFPDGDQGVAHECLAAAVNARRPELERRYAEIHARWIDMRYPSSCLPADVASIFLAACRPAEALAAAEASLAQGCSDLGGARRRAALVGLGRFAEAAGSPAEGYLDGHERGDHAIALALSGQRAAGAEVALGGLLPGVEPKEGSPEERLFVLGALLASSAPLDGLARPWSCAGELDEADRLAATGGRYVTALMLDEGRARLDRALQLAPAHRAALQGKVYLLSVEHELAEAAQLGERAVAADAAGAPMFRNLGYVYEQLGRCDRAVPLYERARALAPLEVANYRNLAKCLDLLGRTGEADAAWRFVPGGRGERYAWWMLAALVVGVALLYLGTKLALIKLLPERFGHLKFP